MKTPSLLALLACAALLLGCGGGGSPTPAEPSPPAPPSPPLTPPTFEDGFEAGLDLWTADADVPPSPEDPMVPVTWSIEPVDTPVYEGAQSAEFTIDGRQDDGTIWLERAFDVTPGAAYTVHVSTRWWSEHASFTSAALVVDYAGATSPEAELDFTVVGVLDQVSGWKRYVADLPAHGGADGKLWVGVGFSVVFETWITHDLDDVRIWIEPAP